MNKIQNLIITLGTWSALFLVILGFKPPYQMIESLSLDLVSKNLHKGKSVTITSEVYYKISGGVMITKYKSPQKKVSITNVNGEFKEYNYKTNQVTLLQGQDLSSKSSLFFIFLSGNMNDLALSSTGFKLNKTRVENKMVITDWVPNGEIDNGISKAELVHENYLPIFLGFYDLKNKPIHKTYYSNFQKIGQSKIPLTVTEIEYVGEKDSVITKRVYTNIKLNGEVDPSLSGFQIPAGAKIVKPNPNEIKKKG
jgi:outer membrane lipoprotein-sorting protein